MHTHNHLSQIIHCTAPACSWIGLLRSLKHLCLALSLSHTHTRHKAAPQRGSLKCLYTKQCLNNVTPGLRLGAHSTSTVGEGAVPHHAVNLYNLLDRTHSLTATVSRQSQVIDQTLLSVTELANKIKWVSEQVRTRRRFLETM